MSNRTRQKNKRGDSKVESNDSPEIPDRVETSDIPSLPSGDIDVKLIPLYKIKLKGALMHSNRLVKQHFVNK